MRGYEGIPLDTQTEVIVPLRLRTQCLWIEERVHPSTYC